LTGYALPTAALPEIFSIISLSDRSYLSKLAGLFWQCKAVSLEKNALLPDIDAYGACLSAR